MSFGPSMYTLSNHPCSFYYNVTLASCEPCDFTVWRMPAMKHFKISKSPFKWFLYIFSIFIWKGMSSFICIKSELFIHSLSSTWILNPDLDHDEQISPFPQIDSSVNFVWDEDHSLVLKVKVLKIAASKIGFIRIVCACINSNIPWAVPEPNK